MKRYQLILLALSLALNVVALGAIIFPAERLPEVSVEESQKYMDECVARGGWSASSGYISQERVLHICYGVNNGKRVVFDVTYR